MSIAEAERWLSPVVNYDQASMDEAAAAKWVRPPSSRPCGYAGSGSDPWREKKAAPKKAAEQQYRRARHSTNRAWLHDFFACFDADRRARKQIYAGAKSHSGVPPAAWSGPHNLRSGFSGVRQAMGEPAKPAGARRSAPSICCSLRPLPRSRPFARGNANSPRW